ncbi:MAG: mandelate racemase/muconate lactonizing enzyme family protein [Salinirussus sp.]
MEITDVRVRTFAVPLDQPRKLSLRTADQLTAAIVIVDTNTGLRGLGEASAPDAQTAKTIIEDRFRDHLIGADPLDRASLTSELLGGTYPEQTGSAVAAASGVDVALWDIAGKHYDAPVCELAGGVPTSIRAYASNLYWDDPAAMGEKAARFVDNGFDAVKTHLGQDPRADERRVAAIREAIGDDVDLLVDANCGYDRPTAVREARMLADYDVFWFEEPIDPADLDGYTRLADEAPVPIAAGENVFRARGFRRLLERDAIDYAMPDVIRAGGISEMLKIFGIADAHNTNVSIHNFGTGIGLAATLHVSAASPGIDLLEFDADGWPLYEPLLADSLQIENGMVAVPEGAGLGVELPDEIDDYETGGAAAR